MVWNFYLFFVIVDFIGIILKKLLICYEWYGILLSDSLDVKKYLLLMKFIDYLVYFVKLFDIKNVYIRYVVNDFIDGNVLDFLMFVEVCFDDGGLCIVNIFIFNNVFVLKF